MTFRIENLGVTLLPERRTSGGKKGAEFLAPTACSIPSEEGCICCEHSLAEGTQRAVVPGQDAQALHAQLDEFLASVS
jgi:hypothetical protein